LNNSAGSLEEAGVCTEENDGSRTREAEEEVSKGSVLYLPRSSLQKEKRKNFDEENAKAERRRKRLRGR